MSKMLDALGKERLLIGEEKGGLSEEAKDLDVCMDWIKAGEEIE